MFCDWSGLFTRRWSVYLSAGRSWLVGQTALRHHGLFGVPSQCLCLPPRLAGRWAEVLERISSRVRANRPFPHTLTFPDETKQGRKALFWLMLRGQSMTVGQECRLLYCDCLSQEAERRMLVTRILCFLLGFSRRPQPLRWRHPHSGFPLHLNFPENTLICILYPHRGMPSR